MTSDSLCPTCGNPLDAETSTCPYCGSAVVPSRGGERGKSYQVVNLEAGHPTVPQAIAKLERRIETARKQGVKVLKVIHGYGSSGKGGSLRDAVRRVLPELERQGPVRSHVAGEHFAKSSSIVRQFPRLREDADLGRGNRGVTLVILR
jgi:uncharacterized Zn finger protein (UPF0148 family)